MDNESPEPKDSKEVLEYYRLFGKDRDIRQYLNLPPILDLNDSNGTLCEENVERNSNKTATEEKNKLSGTSKVNKSDEPEINKTDEECTPDKKTDKTMKTKSPTCERSVKSTNILSKDKDFVFNIESEIEINYDLEVPQHFDECRQVKFEDLLSKPKGILKIDNKYGDTEGPATSNRRNTVSPTSSVASNKRLEWDSLADIGYTNSDDAKKPLSTLERIALQQGHKTQYGENIQESGDKTISKEEKEDFRLKTTKIRKFIGKPTAESTPIVLKTDIITSDSEYVSNIKPIAENIIKPDNPEYVEKSKPKNILKQHKSLNDIDLKSVIPKTVDKYIQTSLPRKSEESSSSSTSNTNTEIAYEDSQNGKNGKENIRMTPIKNASKSKLIKKRMARRKLISTKSGSAKSDEDLIIDKQSQNSLEVLKGDNRFNISQSSVSSSAIAASHVNENFITVADSFEFVPHRLYDQKANKNSVDDNTSSGSKSAITQSLKRNIKISKNSSSSKDYVTSGTSTNLSSNNNDPLFEDVKLSTLNHDIRTSIRLLNCLMTSKKGNVELKKRMVKRIVKRLLEANYGDESSTSGSRSQSKLNDYSSSTTNINSATCVDSKNILTPQSASPDPKYSLPENLIANVPWKPHKFAQGFDFIRIPTKENVREIINPSDQEKQKSKSVFTMKGKNEIYYPDASNSRTLDSFKDLAKDFLKSPEKINLLNDQQKLMEQNLVQQQIQSKQHQDMLSGTGLINYAKQEKDIQLAWIKSEIEHLNYLKMLLENKSETTKFDSIGPYKVSEKGDNKFDFNFFSNLGHIANRNTVYPLLTDCVDKTCSEKKTCTCKNLIEKPACSETEKKTKHPHKSGSSNDLSSAKDESSKSSKSSFKKQSDNLHDQATPSSSDKHISSSSKNDESIRDQIKKLTRSIEMLKQSTQLAKIQNTSAHTSRLSYQDWDSHINICKPYSEIINIDEARKQKHSTKSSYHSTSNTNLSKEKHAVVEQQTSRINSKADSKIKDYSPQSKVIESSGTHTSLKSATISLIEQNKSTELSSAEPVWERYEKNSAKSNVQTISTQTSDSVVDSGDKMVEAVLVSCNHCKNCSCKCNKKTQTIVKKEKKTKPPVAYILTFETDSTPSNSSKNGKKPSLDEVKVKLPYNRENKKTKQQKNKAISTNKSHKCQYDGKNSEKTVIKLFDAKSKFDTNGSQELHCINLGKLSKKISKHKNSDISEDTETTLENNSVVLSESTLLSTSTDSFLISKEKRDPEKKHKPTVQECLVIYKSDFVKNADRRRDIINKISQLRSQRNSERKKLLQLIEAEPKLKSEIANVQKMLPQRTKSQKIFTTKEIREMSRKKYKNLPEVTQKKKDALRNNLYRNNRFIANIFNKKLQKKVLQGKHTLSHSMNIINGLD